MPEPTRGIAQVRRSARADIYFALYAAMGSTRSLRLVSEVAGQAGIPISHKTLQEYSRKDGWAERVKAFDEQARQTVATIALDQAVANRVQQAQLGRGLQQLATIGLTTKINAAMPPGATAPRDIGITGAEISRLADIGVKIERLASGEATEIRHVAVRFYGLIIHDIAEVWRESLQAAMAVMQGAGVDDETRQRALDAATSTFVPAADRVLTQHLAAMGMHDVVVTSTDGGEGFPE